MSNNQLPEEVMRMIRKAANVYRLNSANKMMIEESCFISACEWALSNPELLKAMEYVKQEEVRNAASVGWDASFWQREKIIHDRDNTKLEEPVEWFGPQTFKCKTDFLDQLYPLPSPPNNNEI